MERGGTFHGGMVLFMGGGTSLGVDFGLYLDDGRWGGAAVTGGGKARSH